MDGRGETFSTILRLLNLSRSKITRLIVVIVSILEKSSFEKVGATYLAFVFYDLSCIYQYVASEQSRKEKRFLIWISKIEATCRVCLRSIWNFLVSSSNHESKLVYSEACVYI